MDVKDQGKYAALNEMLQRKRAEESFYEFFKQAWPLIEGNNPYIDSWSTGALCEHIQAVINREIRFLLINAPPRSLKPVGKDSLLLRNDGQRIPIKDIKIGNKILTHKGRFKRVANKFYQGELETLKIITYSGREIIAAPDHPFLTPNGWVNAQDLQVQDVLATTKVLSDFGKPMRPEEARLLGYLIGDGCLVMNALNITACDEIEMQDIEHCCKTLGFKAKRQQYGLSKRPAHHNQNFSRINISRDLQKPRDWVEKHGIKNKNSYTKRIPQQIMQGNFETIVHFLGAYYACDGTYSRKGILRKDGAISITSVSKELLEDAQHLLTRLGIRTRIRKRIQNIKTKKQGNVYVCYQLELGSQDDLYNFIRLIPIYHSKLQKLLNLKIIRQRFDNDLLPDPIVSIEKNGKEECYCLEIEDDHTFTANDIVVHNSTILSVALCPWAWLKNPRERFLYSSYAQRLSERDSVRSRRVIESDWYQLRWGNKIKLRPDQNTKIKFENDLTGYRMCTSQNSTATGDGGSILILDDPNNAQDLQSEIMLESRLLWYSGTWSTRMNDPVNDCRIVMQQRISEKDISGYILSHDDDNLWTKLILPMEFESNRRCKTIILPSTNGKVWEDPRQIEGEILNPERIGPIELAQLKQGLGSQYRIAGQLQQRPAPEEGGILKAAWFKWWKFSVPPKIEHVIQSWDTALGAKDENCFSACTTWGLFLDENKLMNVILLSLWRGKVEYPELRRIAQALYQDYNYDKDKRPNPIDKKCVPDVVLVESKSSGISLIQDLMRAGIAATKFDPDKHGDKIVRVRLISHFIEGGRVWLPAKPPAYTQLRDYGELLAHQAKLFPAAESRDLIDTMTQVLLRLRDSGYLNSKVDDNMFSNTVSSRNPNRTKEKRPYY